MQAYEFNATAQNGFIRIPDEYVKKIGTDFRVVLYTNPESKQDTSSKHMSLLDLAGIFKGCEDMDAKDIRAERRKKYEDID